jgi:lipopolysaccharide export system permease protein
MGSFLAIAVIVDFFDRFEGFLHHGASAGPILRYFLFKVPLFVTRVAPIAILAGALVGFGGLARHNEFVALRAAGVSVWQIASASLGAGLVISALMFAWNEQVVPYASQRAHDIYAIEIRSPMKRRPVKRRVWHRGEAGFYSIKRMSNRQRLLVGLTIYQVRDGFQPDRVIDVDRATWNGERWVFSGVRAYALDDNGRVETEDAPQFELPERPEDLVAVYGNADEFSYMGLRRHIEDLRRKGADPSNRLVDLHLKLALPLVGLVMLMIGLPLSITGSRRTSVASAVAVGLAIGFSYFVVLAFARALGQTGVLDPLVAAWTANGIFGLIGLFLLLGAD